MEIFVDRRLVDRSLRRSRALCVSAAGALAVAALLSAQTPASHPGPAAPTNPKAFLDTYCISCHSGDKECCAMIQACCNCLKQCCESGCCCYICFNNTPVCCGTCA